MIKKQSYISTTILPMKVISNDNVIQAAKSHTLFPAHVKIYPTNKCKNKCPNCTFGATDHGAEIPFERLIAMTNSLIKHGMQAVTLTGGGDPLEYPHISEYIQYLKKKGITIGLITSGYKLKDIPKEVIGMLMWCRVSVGDFRGIEAAGLQTVARIKIDWSLSYLVTKAPSIDNIATCLKFAADNNFTHVRFVDDILDENSDLEYVKKELAERDIDTRLIIYQGTKNYTRGHQRCLVSLLKPVISPDGHIRPCCGSVYRNIPPTLAFDPDSSMGTEVNNIYDTQAYFDGSKCQRCYESETNNYLNILWDADQIQHKTFL